MKLKEILAGIPIAEGHAEDTLEITGIRYDSRHVQPGDLFVAVTGYATDGHKFIPMAVEQGAAAVLCERKPECDIPYVLVENSRYAMALASANFFGHPADDMTFVGITGTNGKTSSTYLLKTVLEKTLRAKVGLIGTIQNMIGDEIMRDRAHHPGIL